VDVVIPFRGSAPELHDVLGRAAALRLDASDTLVVVDNSPEAAGLGGPSERVAVLEANDVHTSYFARNRGAARGDAEWILFLDADVEPPSDLLDRYFDSPPGERVGVLAGAVEDAGDAPDAKPTVAERFAELSRPMAQENTMREGDWTYAQTANCAVRRAAFDAVGGFTEDVRSAGDADLCFRVRRAGWEIESRPSATVVHRNRTTLRALLRQRARHGAGVAWLNRAYPGAFPPRRSPGMVWWTAKDTVATVRAIAARDRDRVILTGVRLLWFWALELGRFLPNRVR
jgi:GT2 family glycosyltransferase